MAEALRSIVETIINEQPPVSPGVDRMADDSAAPGPDDEGAPEGTEAAPPDEGTTRTKAVNLPPVSPIFGTQETPEVFNPEIHVTDTAGMPVKTKAGKYRRKPGRKQTGETGNASPSIKTTATVVDSDNLKLQKSIAAANAVVGSLFMLGTVLGGDEFRPIVDPESGRNEPAMLTQAWTEYFLTCEDVAIPAWAGVFIATSAYFIPRFTMPVTRSRLGQIWDWVSGWWKGEETEDKTEAAEA